GNVGAGPVGRGSHRLGSALMQLNLAIAAFECARGIALNVFWVAGILQQRGIAFNARSLGAAKKRRHRNPRKFPPNVPQRDVESRECWASGPERLNESSMRSMRGTSSSSEALCPMARRLIQLSNPATTMGRAVPNDSPQPTTPPLVVTRT